MPKTHARTVDRRRDSGSGRHVSSALAGILWLAGCATPSLTPPPLLAPSAPRRIAVVSHGKAWVRVAGVADRTTLLGGVSNLETGPFYRSGPYLLAHAPSAGSSASAPTAPDSVVGGDPRSPAPRDSGPSPALATAATGGVPLVQTIPDLLLGLLVQSGRVDVLRPEATTSPCDYVLNGSLTAVQQTTATLELALTACATGVVVAQTTSPLRFGASSTEVMAHRDDMLAAVLQLLGQMPAPRDLRRGRVVRREGDTLVLNLGSTHRLVPGLVGYSVTPPPSGDDVRPAALQPDDVLTGDWIVTDVGPTEARARLVSGAGSRTRPGDSIVFR